MNTSIINKMGKSIWSFKFHFNPINHLFSFMPTCQCSISAIVTNKCLVEQQLQLPGTRFRVQCLLQGKFIMWPYEGRETTTNLLSWMTGGDWWYLCIIVQSKEILYCQINYDQGWDCKLQKCPTLLQFHFNRTINRKTKT